MAITPTNLNKSFAIGEPSNRSEPRDLCKEFPWLPAPPKAVRINSDTQDHINQELDFTIAARILGTHAYDNKFVRDAAAIAWEIKGQIYTRQYNRSIFSVVFSDMDEKIKVLSGGPWIIGRDLMVVKDAVDEISILNTVFIWTPIWIRVYNLPPKGYTVKTALNIGEAFGGTVEYDLPNTDVSPNSSKHASKFFLKNFLRVKVKIDIRKGLFNSIPLEVELQDKTIVNQEARIAYEELPDCCFLCGIIGHTFKFCMHYKDTWSQEDLPYNDSIRATRVVPVNPKWFRNIPRNYKPTVKPEAHTKPSKALTISPEIKMEKTVEKSPSPPVKEIPKTVSSSPRPTKFLQTDQSSQNKHSFQTPNPFAYMHPGMDQSFSGGFFKPLINPQVQPNPFYHQQSPMGSISTQYSHYQPNQWGYPPQNQFGQYNPFTPTSWSNSQQPQYVDPHSGYIYPNNQQPIPMVNPIQVVPMDSGSIHSDPNQPPDLSTLKNVVNGKSSYFAPLQKSSDSPISRKRSRSKKNVASKVVADPDFGSKEPVPVHIRTRSSGKTKLVVG